MKELKCVITQLDQINEILFSLPHHRVKPIIALFANEAQKKFYQLLIVNLTYSNIHPHTFQQFIDEVDANDKIVVIMDIPATFQLIESLIKKAQSSFQTLFLLMKDNKKYINMLKKKVGEGQLNILQVHYENGKLVGINEKIKRLVDSNYDMNRAAFYAYGGYLNNFRANMLKFIFKTEAIDVNKLALSYGFSAAPRVKEGKFLKTTVRSQRVKEKKIDKKTKKTKPENENEQKETKKLTSMQKIKLMAQKKTKKILKKKK